MVTVRVFIEDRTRLELFYQKISTSTNPALSAFAEDCHIQHAVNAVREKRGWGDIPSLLLLYYGKGSNVKFVLAVAIPTLLATFNG